MRTALRRYRTALVSVTAFALLLAVRPDMAPKAGASMFAQIKTMFLVLPPIFLVLGLLDAWVPRQAMVRLMGEGSGIRGTLLAFAMGSAAAGPLYGAFPGASMP